MCISFIFHFDFIDHLKDIFSEIRSLNYDKNRTELLQFYSIFTRNEVFSKTASFCVWKIETRCQMFSKTLSYLSSIQIYPCNQSFSMHPDMCGLVIIIYADVFRLNSFWRMPQLLSSFYLNRRQISCDVILQNKNVLDDLRFIISPNYNVIYFLCSVICFWYAFKSLELAIIQTLYSKFKFNFNNSYNWGLKRMMIVCELSLFIYWAIILNKTFESTFKKNVPTSRAYSKEINGTNIEIFHIYVIRICIIS